MLANALNQRNFIVSEYFDKTQPGSFQNGIRCEDLTKLTFPDEIFDIVITEHILEHVPDPMRAFCEVNRVLKKKGLFIFTIPFEVRGHSVTRILPDGSKILPELFHIDPLRTAGALVYTQFSKDDLIQKFLKPNGFEAEIITLNDITAGINNCEVIRARKV
ncbi:MAG: class I SAM-dependent methyltransferase [Candidatus Latescibacteria bacterium]|nr:class I SAM-dependent methyltransferase [Candidatus Latescibacterota bacterium]